MIDPGSLATGVATGIATQKGMKALDTLTGNDEGSSQEGILQLLTEIRDALVPLEKQNKDFAFLLQPYPYEYIIDESWMGKAHLCIFFHDATPIRFDVEGLGTYDVTIGPGWIQCDVHGRLSTTDSQGHQVIVSYRDDALGSGLVGGSSGVSGNVFVTNFPATQPVSGTVGVNVLPAITISGGQSVNVGNLPATQPISGNVGVTSLPNTNGQKTMANSQPVVIASDQASIPVNAGTLGIATNPGYFVPTGGPSGPTQSYGAAGESLGSTGGANTTTVVGGTNKSVKSNAGRLCKVLVTSTGSTAASTIYDNTTNSGTIIGYVPSGAAQGTMYDFQMPAAIGIYVVSPSGAANLTVGWD